MTSCTGCGNKLEASTRFCSNCGLRNTPPVTSAVAYRMERAAEQVHPASKGVSQIFGIDPRMIFLAVILDAMLFGGEVASLGLLTVVSFMAGAVLAVITYKAQRNWYGDDHESALIKACILGILTAIPSPLPAVLYVPSGVVGLFHNMFGKKQPTKPITT